MLGHTHLARHHAAHQEKIAVLSREINQLRTELAGDLALAEALESPELEHQTGEFDSPRAHIHHAAHPAPAADLRLNRVAEFWAAISIGLVMVGFVALFGMAARNTILLVSHYDHLVHVEAQPWNPGTASRGAEERLTPVLLTASLTGLALLPVALQLHQPGHEIEGPMAVVILGGLVSSTLISVDPAVSKLTLPAPSTLSEMRPTLSPKRPACWTSTCFPVRALVISVAGTSVCVWPLTITSMPDTFSAMAKSSLLAGLAVSAPLWLKATTMSAF